jgi:low temperature requirement protein LtrA
MEKPVRFDREIMLEDQDVIVLTNESSLPTCTETKKFCLFGTEKHVEAIERKKQELEEEIQTQDMRRKNLDEKVKRLNCQLSFLKNQGRVSGSTVNINDEKLNEHEMEIGKDEEYEGIHATSEIFGALTNFKIIEYDNDERSLLQKPLLRQYFIGKILYRTKHERKVTWDELFFDLVFVAVIALLGQVLHSDVTSENIKKFIMLFYPIWSCWLNTTNFTNRFGAHDLSFKLYVLLNAVLTLGMGITATHALDKADSTYSVFMGSFLISRVINLLGVGFYAFWFPKFRSFLAVTQIGNIISPTLFLISIFVEEYREILFWLALAVDTSLFYLSVVIIGLFKNAKYRIALNIEHFTERIGLFTIIVLGECISALNLFNSKVTNITSIYLATFLGLLIAVSFQWIYFDVDASRQYLHAVRRHRATGLLWNWLHLPLHLFIVMGASGMAIHLQAIGTADMVSLKSGVVNMAAHAGSSSTTVSYLGRLLFMASFGTALLIISCIGMLHKSLDSSHGHTPRFSKRFRICSRLFVSLLLLVIPLACPENALSPLACIGMTSAFLFYQAMMEEYGRVTK